MNSGYLDAEVLVTSHDQHAITLVVQLPLTREGRAKAEQGFAVTHFAIDWVQQQVVCPTGNTSRLWINARDLHGKDVIHIKFNPADCQTCPRRSLCTKAKSGVRMLTLRPRRRHYLALQKARERQTTTTFREIARRALKSEGNIAQGVHAFDLRRSRYIGLSKTRLDT